MSNTVVVLGGSYAGVSIAHSLLKTTLPAIKDLKVVLVNPSPKFFWNMASVRAIVPGQVKDEQLFQDIAPGFAYAGAAFEFVQGTAENVDVEGKTVEIKTESGVRSLPYNKLVVATGARADLNTPWKNSATHEETLDHLHSIQKKVSAAKSIVVGGGGTTGTETVAELGFEYGTTKEITIITSGATLMAGSLTPAIIAGAEKHIRSLGIKIIPSTRISSTAILPTGQTELTLSSGEKKLVDLYLPTTGLRPNSSFLPASLLDADAKVKVDTFFHASAHIFAVGDVSNLERASAMITFAQAAALHKILDAELRGQKGAEYKVAKKEMMAVALGRKTGTGIAMGFKLPGFMVYMAKGKTLGLNKMGPLVTEGKGM